MTMPSPLSPAKQALLEQRLKTSGAHKVRGPEIPRRSDPGSAPLSFPQHQMWVIDQIMPGNPAYTMPVGYRLRGTLDVPALEESFNAIIKRHEILRTTFAVRDGEPLQIIRPELAIRITVTALDHLALEEREARLRTLASDASVTPFDLSSLPLIRVSLFKLGAAEHVLLITVHHIVADGLSIGLILDEVDTFYRAFTRGEDPRPPDLAVQYADFAAWQRATLASQAGYTSQIEFWQKQLGGELPVLELPGDRPRPALQSFNGSNVFLEIPKALAQDLAVVAAREGCTTFMTLLAAFQVLLYRYSGADNFVVGTPVTLRSPGPLAALIGDLLNMLPLRCDVSGDPTFLELLRRTRQTTLEAFSNRHVPFEVVLDQVNVKRDPGRNPIFQVMMQLLANPTPRIGDLAVSSFQFDHKAAQFDLGLLLYEENGGYVGRFEYCTDVFDPLTIRRLCGHFETLLRAIADRPDQTISRLPLLTESERHQLLEWNRTTVAYPARSLHALIEEQVSRTPDQPAVGFEDQQLSYRELDVRANQLAHYLGELGVGPDVLVGVFMERSVEMVVGLLGILKAGGAYVPIDPEYPQERVAFMLEDAGIQILLTHEQAARRLPTTAAHTICLDRDWTTIARRGRTAPAVDISPENLAYMIYTSGSTGRPKGALNTHAGICNRLLWMQDRYGLTPADTVLQKTPISFDVSVWEFFWPLLAGARLVLARPGGHRDPAYLARLFRDAHVTVLHFVPSMLRAFLAEPTVSTCTSMRHVICSGEALPADLQEAFFSRLACDLHNLYGPTEAAVDVTHWTCQRDHGSRVVPIGRPVANTQIHVLDGALQPLPVGLVGELYIGGVQVARGYHNRPELTAQKFIPDPFSSDPAARLYRTGDLARWLPDGTVDYRGRIDSQVKVRGNRIELGEIEATLGRHPAVAQSVVVVREDERNEKHLVAYLVPTSGAALDTAEVRHFVREHLPEFMVPSAVVLLDALPLSPNGKLDRKALPAPEARADATTAFVAPRDPLEHALARIWSRILNVKRVGLHDSFFDLGGHSLAAIRLMSDVQELTGRALPLATLFEVPTVAGLAEILRRDGWTPSWSSLVPIQAGGSRHPLFLVHAAHGNVLLYRQLVGYLGPDQPVYGLQSQGLNGTAAFHASVEEMAAQYVKEIVTVQPHGPYHVGGYCLGGIIAFEIAQQLTARGEPVASVLLLETYNLSVVSRSKTFLRGPVHLLQNVWFHCANGVALRGQDRTKFFREKIDIAVTRVAMGLRAARDAVRRLGCVQTRAHPRRSQLALKRTNDAAAYRYVPRLYRGRVAVMRASRYFVGFTNSSFGWSDIVRGNLVVRELPVYPKGMLIEPFCRLLADTIRAELDQAASLGEDTAIAAMLGRGSWPRRGQVSVPVPFTPVDGPKPGPPPDRQSLPIASGL